MCNVVTDGDGDDGWGEEVLQAANDTVGTVVDKNYADVAAAETVDDVDDASQCHNDAVERRSDGGDVAIRGVQLVNDNQIADTAEEQEEETVAAAAAGDNDAGGDNHDTDVHFVHSRDVAAAAGGDDGAQAPWAVVHR